MDNLITKTKLIFLMICISSFSLSAADVVVNGSGLSGTYTTISAGINAANSGDRILVSNQSFPYQEDTIFIDKDVTIIPYNDVAHILYEGHIKIILDSISNLTLIGFDSDNTDIYSVFNDTSRNSLTTINIIDCHFDNIYLSQPKTSFYMSYSTSTQVHFTHGDMISNTISSLYLGNFDLSYNNSLSNYIGLHQFTYTGSSNQLGQNNFPTECELFSYYLPFGNVSVYSDTCNIIGNNIGRFLNINEDFPFNLMNNIVTYIDVYLLASRQKGINQMINNNINSRPYFYASYCSNNSKFNFGDFILRQLNNNNSSYALAILAPPASSYNYTTTNLSYNKNSISSYNNQQYIDCNNFSPNNLWFRDSTFLLGPQNNINNNPNPSSEFLNLDLSLNIIGRDGGSYAWNNINPTGNSGFGSLSGSKARITYLNLPTQIFDPSNIKIKAKAVHVN